MIFFLLFSFLFFFTFRRIISFLVLFCRSVGRFLDDVTRRRDAADVARLARRLLFLFFFLLAGFFCFLFPLPSTRPRRPRVGLGVRSFFLLCTEFYRVTLVFYLFFLCNLPSAPSGWSPLPSFTGFLPSFTEFYRVLPSLTRVFCESFAAMSRFCFVFTSNFICRRLCFVSQRNVPSFYRLERSLLGFFTEFYCRFQRPE